MKYFNYLILIIFLVIVSQLKDKIERSEEKLNFSGINEKVIPFYDKFLKEIEIIDSFKLAIGFDKLDEGFSGFCYSFSDGRKKIVLDSPYWEISSEIVKEMLIAHELGHCLCNRDHTSFEDLKWYSVTFYRIISEKINGFLYDGCPDSFMHYSEFSENCYLKHYHYYWQEMRDNCPL